MVTIADDDIVYGAVDGLHQPIQMAKFNASGVPYVERRFKINWSGRHPEHHRTLSNSMGGQPLGTSLREDNNIATQRLVPDLWKDIDGDSELIETD